MIYKIAFLMLVLLGQQRAWATVAISDNDLKVMTIEALMQAMPEAYINIEDLMVKKTVNEEGVEFAVGILNVWTSSNLCRSMLTVTDSTKCQEVATCKVKPLFVSCDQVSEFLKID